MDKSKKNVCGCFSFLRNRVKAPKDRSLIIETIQRREPESFQPDRPKDLNISMDHSLITTQKLFSPANFYKSTIMAPSCKTPQMHSILRPSTRSLFPSKPENSASKVSSSEPTVNEKASFGSKLTSSAEVCKNQFFPNEIKQKVLFIEQGDEAVKKNMFNSPELELLVKSEIENNLPELGISPIKSIISMDDYSDVLHAFNNPISNARLAIPDLFIRNKIKARPLPLLKPSTPRYLNRQSLIPKLRKDNQILLGNLIFK